MSGLRRSASHASAWGSEAAPPRPPAERKQMKAGPGHPGPAFAIKAGDLGGGTGSDREPQ